MPLTVSTLRPGLLVSLKTSVRGNVKYYKETIEPEHRIRGGAAKASWKTEKTVTDPEEFKKASQTRMKARMMIVNVCVPSDFGLLCPDNKIPALEQAIKDARDEAARFNRRATHTRVDVYTISGKIARDDVEAARAIKNEVRELLAEMRQGIKDCDVAVIRKAAGKAKNIGAMLEPGAAEKIKEAVELARSQARKFVKAGEAAAAEIDQAALRKLQEARTSFLDISEGDTELTEPTGSARAVEMSGEEPETPEPPRRRRNRAQAEQEA